MQESESRQKREGEAEGVRTPVVLITGSLGSGKTTLLRRILDEAGGRRIAVLMNEFGEIAIDSQVIRRESVNIVELGGGCVCCSLSGEFDAAVREIIDTAHPEVIVVEATGVAESDALVFEVEESLPEVRLDSVIYIVDADLSVRYPRIGYTTRKQLEVADVILVNKVDLITTDQAKEVEAAIRLHNETALFSRTMGCDVDTNYLFGLEFFPKIPYARRSGYVNPHGEAEFQSFAWSTGTRLAEEKFRQCVRVLPSEVFRAKGFVLLEDRSVLFNYVAGRINFEEFPADLTQLVFIGRHLDRVQRQIENRLSECSC